jgi:prepilin-type N-terminal cleavage/methylation domain-containing protein
MKLPARKHSQRGGFSLIELLVVILIITLLISLTASAVFKTLNKIADVQNTREISDAQTGLVNFMQKFGVDRPPPSRLVLFPRANLYTGATFGPQLEGDSLQYLEMAFRGLKNSTSPFQSAGPGTGIQWNQNIPLSDNGMVLEGDQCLVFFLGGIQVSSGTLNECLGFSTDRNNPMNPAGDKIQPFFEFKAERLVTLKAAPNGPRKLVNVGNAAGLPFFSYLDAYGKQPFAFFSSYKKADNYNRYVNTSVSPPTGFSDCDSLGVWAYNNGIKYQNSETFQIISAGRDGQFGQGSVLVPGPASTWTPATADQSTALYNLAGTNPKAGFDDMANFSDRMLGVPSN